MCGGNSVTMFPHGPTVKSNSVPSHIKGQASLSPPHHQIVQEGNSCIENSRLQKLDSRSSTSDDAGRCWAMQGDAGRCWAMLEFWRPEVGFRCWAMLGDAGRCWAMLGPRTWLTRGAWSCLPISHHSPMSQAYPNSFLSPKDPQCLAFSILGLA
eukprot:EG_transcript_17212